ncbi:hypothetical protein DFQ28_008412 [Apophysomyces sp. BC1034]|nr:hypothetical protein DFQ30_000959 [Apophysomyces sp. BC1015]KAG0180573.1 hypothetical protein DFQ29_000374 [Apophysomyces sp. BC1021]KAG0186036.1 hypothetical protein DFQ28_008412 [Apophysomyces sp. BC1034]
MTCFMCPCLPRRQSEEEELNAFDLTWRNYLPSVAQFCLCIPSCFLRQQPIRLEDDDDPLIDIPHYNNHQLYQGRAIQGYLSNPRDWEFESVLDQNEISGTFVTRNPFGKKKKRSKRSKRLLLEDENAAYEIFSEEQDQPDAEFLGDDQIANLAYQYGDTDQYGEEIYYAPRHGPVLQEMHAPQSKQFYAARSVPFVINDDESYEDIAAVATSSSIPHYAENHETTATTSQTLLDERLGDLNDRLVFIKQNIMEAGKKEDEVDNTTLHTIKNSPKQLPVDKGLSDIDSIVSDALDEYENTTRKTHYAVESAEDDTRRYSSNSEFHMPLTDAHYSTPFGSDQHPFAYFTDPNSAHQDTGDEDRTPGTLGLNVRNVFDIGRKWFSSS